MFSGFIFSFVQAKPDLNSLLVIVDEQENSALCSESTPFTEGVYEALWDKSDSMFYDIKLQDPLKFLHDELDAVPFIQTAKSSGADSILLIKVNYNYMSTGKQYNIKIKEIYYKIYSVSALKTVKNSHKNINLNNSFKSSDDKEKILKKIGYDILKEIL